MRIMGAYVASGMVLYVCVASPARLLFSYILYIYSRITKIVVWLLAVLVMGINYFLVIDELVSFLSFIFMTEETVIVLEFRNLV